MQSFTTICVSQLSIYSELEMVFVVDGGQLKFVTCNRHVLLLK